MLGYENMEKEGKISEYRRRLDKTLASRDLTDKQTLKTLVKNHILGSSLDKNEVCSDNVIEKKTTDLSNFLHMLRSASVDESEVPKACETSHSDWKLKQDNEEFRVMYREGPPGTLYHSLLVEGYIDGPMDACLCISWESTLYKNWWPQSAVPTFKVLSSKCLQKVRIGEQVSVIRMKVPWPLVPRQAVIHYFEFEYFQDDLVVVLISTNSDTVNIDGDIEGFIRDGTLEAKDVPIDIYGGFAYQKVTPQRTYFRQIGNIDLKMDFVPPSLINFMSRQLVGNGFRLYAKAVASANMGDKDFSKALGDQLYTRIHKALYSPCKPHQDLGQKEIKSDSHISDEVHAINSTMGELKDVDDIHKHDQASESSHKNLIACDKAFGEIKEEEGEDTRALKDSCKGEDQILTNKITEGNNVHNEKDTSISGEVEQALGTLEKIIYMIREHSFSRRRFAFGFANKESTTVECSAAKDPSPSKDAECSNGEISAEVSKVEQIDKSSDEHNHEFRAAASNYKIAPSPEKNNANLRETSSAKDSTETPISDISPSEKGNRDSTESGKQRNHRVCCIDFCSGYLRT